MRKNHSVRKSISLFLAAVMVFSASMAFSTVFLSTTAYAYYGTANITPAVTNLTTKSWVTAQAGVGNADLAIDRDENTFWDAGSVSEQSWIQVDLGGTYRGMRKVDIVFASRDGRYKYTLEASGDGESWFTLANRADEAVLGGEDVLIYGVPAIRYLKVTLLEVSEGAIAGISEIRPNNYILRDTLEVGADLSYDTAYLNMKYTTSDSTSEPSSDGRMIGTMQEVGMTTVRFRIWNVPRSESSGNPVTNVNGSCSPEDTLNKSTYANSLGMKVGLDFHYSDSWADPGKQVKPQGWKDLDFEDLKQAVYDFTYQVTADHLAAGVVPDYLQIGNEIINGFLWGNEKIPTGSEPNYAKNDPSYFAKPGGELLWEYWGSQDPEEQAAYDAAWDRFTALVDAGLRGAKAASPTSKTKIHVIVDAGKLAKTQEFWRQLTTRIVNDYDNNFDIMAISYYPQWHGTMADLSDYLHAFATEFPEYELMVSETAHPASGSGNPTGYPYTIQGQADFMKDVMRACNDTINNAATTMLVWEPVIWQTMFTRIGGWGSQYYQANDSTRVFHAAYSTHIQKSNIYLATKTGEAPVLPENVDVLDVEEGTVGSAAVNWDTVNPDSYSSPGSFTVNGTTEYGPVTAFVVVEDVPVPVGVSMTIDKDRIQRTETAQLSLKVELDNGEFVDIDLTEAEVEFLSHNPSIVSVDQYGLVTANKVGSAEITAAVTINGYVFQTNSVYILVDELEANIEGIELSCDSSIVEVGEQLTVTISAKNAIELAGFDLWFAYDSELLELVDVVFDESFGYTYHEGEDGEIRIIGTLIGKESGLTGDIELAKLILVANDIDSLANICLLQGSELSDIWAGLYTVTENIEKQVAIANSDITGGGTAINDLVMVAKAFGKSAGEEGYDPALDMNKDGIIDITDIAYVAARLLGR